MVALFKKLKNWLMPDGDDDYEEEFQEVAKADKSAVETKPAQAQPVKTESSARRMVAGNGHVISERVPIGVINTSLGETSMNGVRYKAYADRSHTPDLKIVKTSNLTVRIYKPTDYNQINDIADDLLAGRAAIVNYEKIKDGTRQRICDYLEGTCYAIDGKSMKITDVIYLYIPVGVEASDMAAAMAKAASFK